MRTGASLKALQKGAVALLSLASSPAKKQPRAMRAKQVSQVYIDERAGQEVEGAPQGAHDRDLSADAAHMTPCTGAYGVSIRNKECKWGTTHLRETLWLTHRARPDLAVHPFP